MIWLAIPAAIICALVNRWRGGLWPGPGNQLRRLGMSAAMTLVYLVAAWPLVGWQWAGVLGALAGGWLGFVFGWGEWFDLGRIKGRWAYDFVCLTIRGRFLSLMFGSKPRHSPTRRLL